MCATCIYIYIYAALAVMCAIPGSCPQQRVAVSRTQNVEDLTSSHKSHTNLYFTCLHRIYPSILGYVREWGNSVLKTNELCFILAEEAKHPFLE